MEHTFNYGSMDSTTTSGSGHKFPQIDPSLEHMFASPTTNEMYIDAAPQESYYNNSGAPITPDSIAPQSEQYHEASAADIDSTVGTDADAEGEDEDDEAAYPPEHWKTLVNFEIPDCRQTHINDIPGLQALHKTYLSSYNPLSSTANITRMQHAKALIFALLTHYYPTSRGYTIAPSSLGPVAANGMPFILAADDKSDIWADLPAKKAKAAKKKKKKRAPTQAELNKANKAAKHHIIQYFSGLKFDHFKPEDIAAFVVLRRTDVAMKNSDSATGESSPRVTHNWQPYTYAAIMISEWDTMPRYSISDSLHRSNILVDAMCQGSNIKDGYGILLYGPMLEFYSFDAGAEWMYREGDDDDDEEPQDVEPKMELIQFSGKELMMDVRDTQIEVVDEAFKVVGMREVTYRDS